MALSRPRTRKIGVKRSVEMLGPDEDGLDEEEAVEDCETGVRKTWMPVPGSRNLENFSAIVPIDPEAS